MSKVTNLTIGLVAGTEREVYAQWEYKKKIPKYNSKGEKSKTEKTLGVKEYTVRWFYFDGKKWFSGGTDQTTSGGEQELRRVTYSVPANATKVKVKVRPEPNTHKKKKTIKGKSSLIDVKYFTGEWSTEVSYNIPTTVTPDAGGVSQISISQLESSSRTILATWIWDKSGTSGYEVVWEYQVVTNGEWLSGSSSTVTLKNATYDIPDTAYAVRIRIKPVAEQSIWTADWTTSNLYYATSLTPSIPSTPTISINKLVLTASVNYTGANATQIEFEMAQDDLEYGKISGRATIQTQSASLQFNLTSGHKYKVRCRAINGINMSAWSEYSSSVGASPSIPRNVAVKAVSSSSVEVVWNGDDYADSFTVEWTNKEEYFDASPSNVHSETGITIPKAIITTGDNGDTYFFRVKAVKNGVDAGESGWSDIASVITGKKPAAPTTWSLSMVAKVGDQVRLYWVHNSQDNSSQTVAQIELTVNGVTTIVTVENDRPEDEKDNISDYFYDTSSLSEGATLTWRVRTRGVYPDYSDWSILRTLKILAPATLYFVFSEERQWFWDPFNFDTDTIHTAPSVGPVYPEIITSLPIDIVAKAGPDTQNALRFTVTLTALDSYESESDTGEIVWVKENEVVYEALVYPQKASVLKNYLFKTISAGDLNFENNARYRLTCTVVMDSGLTAQCSVEFKIGWADNIPEPDAEITIDSEAYTAYIMPFCVNDNGDYIDDVFLSVYRRNYDGSFTEISKDLLSRNRITVTDPHPSLDYARYRIVAKSLETGQIGYYDVPSIEYGETAIIIQWDEKWSNFENSEDTGEPSETAWEGSLLRLPYNIDVSESHDPDVELIEYIGREHPVSYYGTQKGETATWNVDIPANDKDTLYALRRLKAYSGDCYVREPSGTGYWANINVSFSKKHLDLVIPVTLTLVRVEGGA